MSDLIERQAVIDVLHEYFDGMLDTDTVCPVDIYGLFECMPSAQPEQRWIPCSERLPFAEYGESETVFTTCKHREPLLGDGGYLWVKLLYFNGSNWCHPTGEVFNDIVIAWMPLPEPWRGEE